MKPYFCFCAAAALLVLAPPCPAAPDYTLKNSDAAPPKELHESIRTQLGKSCVRLQDAGGPVLELWFRAVVPVKATEAQVANGLTYREVPTSTLIGGVRVLRATTDYRKQKLPVGVYTLRLALQPVSDDHTGTAPYRDFCLLSPAADDRKPDLLTPKALHALSARVTDDHPSVLVLFPGKGAGATAKLVAKPGGHQVLLATLAAQAEARKTTLLIGLTLVGTSVKAPNEHSYGTWLD